MELLVQGPTPSKEGMTVGHLAGIISSLQADLGLRRGCYINSRHPSSNWRSELIRQQPRTVICHSGVVCVFQGGECSTRSRQVPTRRKRREAIEVESLSADIGDETPRKPEGWTAGRPEGGQGDRRLGGRTGRTRRRSKHRAPSKRASGLMRPGPSLIT
jgi:hypothetical protein